LDSTVNAKELARYKKLLLAKQEELAILQEEPTLVPPAAIREGDLMDQARADVEAEFQVHARETNARLARAVDDALARIRGGTFGVCQSCKQPISIPRLEAVPWARLCRQCEEQEQSKA
jgi:RNA polymerase-binding protein DksA